MVAVSLQGIQPTMIVHQRLKRWRPLTMSQFHGLLAASRNRRVSRTAFALARNDWKVRVLYPRSACEQNQTVGGLIKACLAAGSCEPGPEEGGRRCFVQPLLYDRSLGETWWSATTPRLACSRFTW